MAESQTLRAEWEVWKENKWQRSTREQNNANIGGKVRAREKDIVSRDNKHSFRSNEFCYGTAGAFAKG